MSAEILSWLQGYLAPYLASSDASLLYRIWLGNALFSAVATLLVWLSLPRHYRQPGLPVMILLFFIGFFAPVVGVAGWLVLLVAVWWPRARQTTPPGETRSPRFEMQHGPQRAGHLRLGQVRNQLASATVPLDLRMKALLALQEVPGRQASEILREVLVDPADDLRLLAFGMLDVKEKQLNERIHEATRALHEAAGPEAEYAGSKQLAELYWEMAYQGLVQGDMRAYALEQVRQYLSRALAHHQVDAGLWVLAGRMYLQEHDPERARKAFDMAVAAGFPPVRVQPYLAELAFLHRDFAAVREHMRQVQHDGRSQQITRVADYWGRA